MLAALDAGNPDDVAGDGFGDFDAVQALGDEQFVGLGVGDGAVAVDVAEAVRRVMLPRWMRPMAYLPW
jgi:hypothetical protein